MKKLFLLAGVLAVTLSSCLNSDDEAIQQEQERYVENINDIQDYISANGLVYMERFPENSQEPYFYYEVTHPGNPDTLITDSTALATLSYEGTLLNDTLITQVDSLELEFTFDSQGNIQEIELVEEELPDSVETLAPEYVIASPIIFEVGKGGSIDMLLPARYAYGSGTGVLQEGMATVPAYAPVRFTLQVLDIRPTDED